MTRPGSPGADRSVNALTETGRSILQVNLSEIVFWTILIILSAIAAYVVYRAMERPRLRLTDTDEGLRASRRDVIAYAVTIPFLIFSWWLFFWLILLIADTNLDVVTLTTIPAAIVLAARVLAHANQRIAHEIAKAVPLTIITLIIITGSLRDEADLFQLLDDAERVDITWGAVVFVLIADYVITAIWYWGYIRWWKPRRAARRATPSVIATDELDPHVDHPRTVSPEKY